ncbi:MAG TPA: DsbA family protein [Steroidobacteraceae bacterium]|jgi:thiol:disulfide interchange protein DsbA
MTRKLSPAVLTISVAVLIALAVWWRHSHAPQQAAQNAASAPGQPSETAAPAAGNHQPVAVARPAASGGPVSSAQAAEADSTSLERLAAVPASSALPESSEWKAGVNYDVISPAQPTTVAPGKVEVLEVFWLGCPHCYALEPYIRQWLKNKPAYVQFVRVPVMWGPVHRAHAQLFYTLESLGRDDLVEKVFAYMHDVEAQSGSESVLFSNSKEDTLKQQESWAEQNGLSAGTFEKAYSSFYVGTQVQQADEITNGYQVQGVPFIAVDGKFSTDVGKAGSENKLISVINFLAAWEHDHKQGTG